MIRLRAHLALFVTVALVSASMTSVAWSQAPPSAAEIDRATALKKQADALMDELKFADAYALYAQSYAINADPALLYNEGRALQALGEYPEALAKLEEFARVAPPDVRARAGALDDLIADVKAHISSLVVAVNVEGARVLVREKFVGIAPAAKTFAVRSGPADVQVLADGYEPFRTHVDLPPGASLTVEAKLIAKRLIAVLSLDGSPQGSAVLIDETPTGTLPLEARLAPGPHTLIVRQRGFIDEEISVDLTPGERRRMTVNLHPPPPIYTKWWFWTGIGVVVVAGVVTTVALMSDKSLGSGSFSPGTVHSPLTVHF